MATATTTNKTGSQAPPPKAAVGGRFGAYGGRYVPETLMAALEELERAYEKAKRDRKFQKRLDHLLKTYAGRPTPLFFARRLTAKLGGAKIYLKREDLLHTGAHKINNCLGQGLLVERMGKRRVIAETGAGQHGVATATVCALLGFELRRVHGHGGHAPPGTQCLPHEGCSAPKFAPFEFRFAHPQRRHQRSHA